MRNELQFPAVSQPSEGLGVPGSNPGPRFNHWFMSKGLFRCQGTFVQRRPPGLRMTTQILHMNSKE